MDPHYVKAVSFIKLMTLYFNGNIRQRSDVLSFIPPLIVNFTNILLAAFEPTNSKSAKNTVELVILFYAFRIFTCKSFG